VGWVEKWERKKMTDVLYTLDFYLTWKSLKEANRSKTPADIPANQIRLGGRCANTDIASKIKEAFKDGQYERTGAFTRYLRDNPHVRA
tara:strand:- start:4926 stop:5189 length:264 start_codon:yes stop_codon:yes gene_type:complete